MPFRPALRTPFALVTAAALLSTAVAGCGGDEKAGDDGPGTQRTESGRTLQARWPLTGLEVTGSAPKHPPLVVKLDNTVASRPQVGLRKADLVTEELVEGGLTRLAVFYDSSLPALVGPVRSMRASDIGVVKPVGGVLVTSGAAGPTIGRLKAAKVTYRSNDGGSTGFYRDGSRRAPYNLMMRLQELARTMKAPAEAPQAYLPWGSEQDFTGGAAATSIQARFGSGHTTSWAYQGGKYVNTNTNAAAGADFRPDTVLVVRVRQGDAGYLDPAGNPVPETIYKGTGKAFLFHKGQLVRGTWSKKDASSALKLRTKAGVLKVPAGHTWIELLPTDPAGGRLTFGR